MNRYLTILLILCLSPWTLRATLPHKDHSVLAQGRWFKLVVTQTGIHQITYNDFVTLGIDPETVDISKIRVFGNGSGMLPEMNVTPRIDDLREIAIMVRDDGNGRLDPGDDLLFYGEQADKWTYDRQKHYFIHQRNLYSDSTYYFLNINTDVGVRVINADPPVGNPENVITNYEDYQLHELDSLSLLRSGREWYGELFDKSRNSRDFHFVIPDIDSTFIFRLKTSVVAKSPYISYFFISHNNKKIDSLKVDSSDPSAHTLMGRATTKYSYISNPKPDVTINLTYKLPTPSSTGWLNYLELSYARKLVWSGPQMLFRCGTITGPGKHSEFRITNANASIEVWDVSDPAAIKILQTSLQHDTLIFHQHSDTLHEFVAFDHSVFHSVKCLGELANQDLHASEPAEMVIVTHPRFKDQAQQLAEFHRSENGLTTLIATTDQVFNEFASGRPDPTAIRDFMKLFFDRSGGETPKYLLLFGDGSYDPKNRIPGNNNYIPTFQSQESLAGTASYVTDDYYGIMADQSGQSANGRIDIGIGRFPVSTVEEALAVINKILHYDKKEYPVRSAWRNNVAFVADDEDHNLHMHQAEELCKIVADKYPVFNINKIYLDAYQIEPIPGGYRFPDATAAINRAVDKGSLIINYTGHGGETGWSYEQALNTSDIQAWTNFDRLPVFITATCEFSRFDNPERFTAGEMVILHENGGAIALYSTTRLAFAGQNIKLDTSFFRHLMDRDDHGQYIKMGDLIRISKNNNLNSESLRNFVLLGDPAQSIAFPEMKVVTREINHIFPDQADTVKGMSTVEIKGRIEDESGNTLTSYDGSLNCRIFDKQVTFRTLANQQGVTYPEDFKMQNSLIFSADVPVKNGEFIVKGVIPRAISLPFGSGKISYYAWNDVQDANGFSDKIVIGGMENFSPVNPGPDISLFLGDRSFTSGARTTSAPLLLADLYDENGINAIGLGIGHEITMTIDNDRVHSTLLNDYYQPEFNSFTNGTVTCKLSGLSAGLHTLSLKAWDLFDNSSEKSIMFFVSGTTNLTVKNVMNVPNPMFDHTTFIFEPQQQVDGGIEVEIRIYDLNGRMVRALKTGWQIPQDNSMALSWDGTDANGRKLNSGLYPYKIIFKGANGSYSETTQKLVIIK